MHAQDRVKGAMCVQRFDDSLNPAIHITYRISLRSSSYPEPRDPSLSDMVVLILPIKGIIENKISSSKNNCVTDYPTWSFMKEKRNADEIVT